MRSLKITVALAAVACVVAALASPALAAKEHPKAFFGEFFANVPSGGPVTPEHPVTAKTKEGELGALYFGTHEEKGAFAFQCGKLTSQATVSWEHSENFLTELKFGKCTAERRLRENLTERGIKTKFSKGFEMEFHANGSAEVGKSEGTATIVKGSKIELKVKGSTCKIIIPEQTIPLKAEKNPELEFESAEYGTFEESEEKLKIYPNGIKDELEIAWELEKLVFYVPAEEGGACEYTKAPGGKYNPELKVVEIKGYFEGELEEIKVKNGNVGFRTAAEIKKEEEEKEV